MSPNMVPTSISSSVATTNTKSEKDLPKAMVKPNVLTHVIEGFIIQESPEPFPVSRQRYSDRDEQIEPPSKYYYLYFLAILKEKFYSKQST